LFGTCTIVGVSPAPPAINDLRRRAIFELLGPNLQFRTETNGTVIAAATSTLWVADASGLAKGTQLVLTDGVNSEIVKVAAAPTIVPNVSTAVTIAPPLRNAYTVAQTQLFANVTQATHGETQTEQILGDGDASQEWQEFAISISPISYVPDATAESGAASTLQVFVDGFEWTEVPSFYGRGPDETIFVTRVNENGKTYVRFGDGKTGRRVPTGSRNVRAEMRKGIGSEGNAAPGTITVLLQPQPGLKSVINPVAAFGGTDAETVAGVRQNAPSTVITLGRAVSLKDYEALTLSYKGGVSKARATWADFNGQRGVALTVAATGGGAIEPLVQPLRAFLDLRRDPNVRLSIGGATHVHFVFRARVHVLEGYKQSVAKAACEAALGPNASNSGYLDFENLQFGQTMFQSALLTVLQECTGVEWVELLQFTESASAAGRGFGADVLRREAVFVDATEIAWPTLSDSDSSSEVELTYTGGVNDLEVV
jgi:predicted phage baseplate assembly protein